LASPQAVAAQFGIPSLIQLPGEHFVLLCPMYHEVLVILSPSPIIVSLIAAIHPIIPDLKRWGYPPLLTKKPPATHLRSRGLLPACMRMSVHDAVVGHNPDRTADDHDDHKQADEERHQVVARLLFF